MSPRNRWRVCSWRDGPTSCPELTDHPTGRCPAHPRQAWAGMGHGPRLGKSGWQQQRDNKRTLRRHRGICHVCGKPGATVVDHVIPLAEGGTDTETNRAPIHADPCHRTKTAAEAKRGRAR